MTSSAPIDRARPFLILCLSRFPPHMTGWSESHVLRRAGQSDRSEFHQGFHSPTSIG